MPVLDFNLPDTVTQITQPVVQGIMSQLMAATGIPSDTDLLILSRDERASVQGSTIDGRTRDSRMAGQRRLKVKYNEDYDTDHIVNIMPRYRMHNHVFMDEVCGLVLSPIYAQKTLTLEISLQTTSETEVENWLAEFVRRTAQFRLVLPHELNYSYAVPIEFIQVAEAIHANQLAYEPQSGDFASYLQQHITPRATVMTGLAGIGQSLSITETQQNVWGIFDFEVIPDKPELVDEIWQITFTYKIEYQKAFGCRIQYPIMAYNRLLPDHLIAFGNAGYDPERNPTRTSPNMVGLRYFDTNAQARRLRDLDYMARIPYYDDTVLTNIPSNTSSVMIALCDVDTDKRFVLDLNQLGDFYLDPDIMEFMVKSEWPYMVRHNQSILQLHLYHGEYTVPMDQTYLTSDLRFGSKRDLKLTEQHRVRLSLLTNWSVIPQSAIERMRQYPRALIKIVATLNALVRNHPDSGRVLGMTSFTPRELHDVVRLVKGRYGVGMNPTVHSGDDVGGLFNDITPAELDYYHRTRMTTMTVQTQYLTCRYMFNVLTSPDRD